MYKEFTPFIIKYLEAIKSDYANTMTVTSEPLTESQWSIRKKMRLEFNDGVHYTVGKKYIKVVTGSSVHSFIVNTDTDSKFRKGDILKAASWAAPARNSSRGNIMTDYTTQWTGAPYIN